MPSFGGGRVAATEWRRVVDACSDQLRKLHGLREGVLHYTREDHDLGAQCVLLDSNQPHDVVFMSRSLEESTGLSSASVIGKSQLEFMCPSIHWLDDLFNGAERRYVLDFYHSCMRSPPVYGKEEDSVLSLMVFVKATGTPFWALVHTLPVKLAEGEAPPKAASYILHMVVPLEAPVPDSIWIHEAGEARLAAKANIEAIRPFLDQVQVDVKTRVMDASVVSLVPAAERRLKAFQELMADSFLGIRFVPRLGREAAAEFERLGFREKVFEALEEALKKAWEANDEVCKNTSVGALPVGTSALASAVSDPTAQDCPLVYISAGFEELTGFKACWALGRNCRFLQPQQAGNAPMAVNRSEVERMRTFCKAGSGSMIVLLLNESAAGQYFWNLLFMQHLFLGRQDHSGISRHYIFAVQTEIRTPNLRQLVLQPWESGAGEFRLQRLRELFRAHEANFNPREKSLLALCDETFQQWAQEVTEKTGPLWSAGGETMIANEGVEDFADKWPTLFDAACGTMRRIFRMGEQDLRDMRANIPGGVVFCVSDPITKDCPLTFVSRGFEEMTGFKADFALGKNCRFLQPVVRNVNTIVNGEELLRLRSFCECTDGVIDKEAMVSLLLNERKTGERFWNLLHMHHLSIEGKRYILAVQSILRVPMPTMLRTARAMTPVEEAQHSQFLDQLGQMMSKIRPLVTQQGVTDMQGAVQIATQSLKAFLQSACPDYEGDHWVPCLGLEEASIFQKDMLWKKVVEDMRTTLKKIWEVSEGCEEEVSIAIADPGGKDCPLVYVSPKFEAITGYSREWVIGRNCRFLQPNLAWCNAVTNREELKSMHSFCEDALPTGTRIVNLLINERKSRYPFINLLVMEHVEVQLPAEAGGGEASALYRKQGTRPFIFGVQTAIDSQTCALVELLAMDREGLRQLDRLRQILRRREGTLRFQSLNTFARECVADWLPGLPAYFILPRMRLGAPPSWKRASVPALGLEVNASNMLEVVPQALEEGVRHFYLTFPVEERHGESPVQGRLLALRLAELLNLMVPGFYHYLRSNVSLTLVTPPCFVRTYEDVSKALQLHGYVLDAWLLDLRGGSDRWDVKLIDYWRTMSGVRRSGGVGNIGVVGASRDVCDRLSTEMGSVPIGVYGVELYPGRAWQEPREKAHFEQQVLRGTLIVAFNVFGPKQSLLESPALAAEAERLRADPATLLMKWVEGQGFAMMVPKLRAQRPRRAQKREASPSAPSKGREPNFHRSFAKEYGKLLPGAVDDFFRRCPDLQGRAELQSLGSSPQSARTRRPAATLEGAQSSRRRHADMRSMDDASALGRPASEIQGALGSGFDLDGVRSAMRWQQAAAGSSLALGSTPKGGLQSLASEFSLALPGDDPVPSLATRPPAERRPDQFVRRSSTSEARSGRALGG